MATISPCIDLSKQLSSISEPDGSGRLIQRRHMRRGAFAAWLGAAAAG